MINNINIVISRIVKRIADHNPKCIKDYHVDHIVNVESGQSEGWAAVFRLNGKFSYDNILLNGVAELFNSNDWCVKVVRCAIEFSVYVNNKEAEMLKLREDLNNENDPD